MRPTPVQRPGLPVRRGLTVLVLLASGALIAAGCGGGSGDSGGGGSASPDTTAAPSPATAAPDDNGGGSGGSGQANIENFAFDPKQLTAKVGETVTWKNDDSTSHTVTADDGSFDSGSLASEKTFSQKFDKPGTYQYHCALHSSMIATVVVS